MTSKDLEPFALMLERAESNPWMYVEKAISELPSKPHELSRNEHDGEL